MEEEEAIIIIINAAAVAVAEIIIMEAAEEAMPSFQASKLVQSNVVVVVQRLPVVEVDAVVVGVVAVDEVIWVVVQ